MEFIKVIGFCIVAACAYGILLDQVTVRVCLEYFTIGHPPVFRTESPTLLALGWGVIASWWVGAILGVPVSMAARTGAKPKLTWSDVVRPTATLLAIMAGCAAVAGGIGWICARKGWVFLLEPMASRVPHERHVAFLADLWAHLGSYVVGFVGGLILCARLLAKRKSRAMARS